MKRAGAPKGNQNRLKGDTAATSQLAFRCTPDMRKAVVKAARTEGVTVSDWLNKAARAAL